MEWNTKSKFDRKKLDEYLNRTGQNMDDLREGIVYFGLDGIMEHIEIANKANKTVHYYYAPKSIKAPLNRMYIRYQ